MKNKYIDLKNRPQINVVDDNTFRQRVGVIFNMVATALSKSYGPYGSSSIVVNYPYHHISKDGYTIMKYLSMSKEKNEVDDSIKMLIQGPCTRLNFLVGDGTTTAIIAVNAIYQEYLKNKNNNAFNNIPPRDIMKSYNKIRDDIIKALDKYITRVSNSDNIVDIMKKVAYISSNGDDTITDIISSLYEELGSPLINVRKAPDGITKKIITTGFQFDAILTDSIYVNNDDRTAELKDVDIIMFDHKVTRDTYDKIIKPLSVFCNGCSRKLVVLAPVYDDVAMLYIRRELLTEYKQTNTINTVLCVAQITSGNNRDIYEDLSILLNTTIITRGIEDDIIKALDKDLSKHIISYIDINNRGINNINILTGDINNLKVIKYNSDKDNIIFNIEEDAISCGFAGRVTIGMENGSVFDDLHYNEELYNKTIENVKDMYNKSLAKNAELGNMDLSSERLQTRLFKLRMKLGTIEVGGNSTMSIDLLKDAVDDTVKATQSAYENGVVNGCSLATIMAILDVINDNNYNQLENAIINIMLKGFYEVYKTLLRSRYESSLSGIINSNDKDYFYTIKNTLKIDNIDIKRNMNNIDDIYDTIIDTSINLKLPLDITTGKFTNDIINSARTDKEVLITSSDLISLLITGNQLIVTDHNNYM